MRIAIFSDNFYPELSGVSDFVATMTAELARRGHRIRLYVPTYRAKDYELIKAPVREPDLGPEVEVVRVWSWPAKYSPSCQAQIVPFTGCRAWSLRSLKPDIIHIQFGSPFGWDAILAAKILRIPLVGTSHTPVTEFVEYSPIKGNGLRVFSRMPSPGAITVAIS